MILGNEAIVISKDEAKLIVNFIHTVLARNGFTLKSYKELQKNGMLEIFNELRIASMEDQNET
jgi:hypothetical protein